MVKERCKENVEILQNQINELPPPAAMSDYRAVQKELKKITQLPDKICHSVSLLKVTKPYLNKIKSITGSADPRYLNLSTLVVNGALYNIIEEVNEVQQEVAKRSSLYVSDLSIAAIKRAVSEAWQAILLMDKFDMEEEFKLNRYSENKKILKQLCDQLDIFSSLPSTSHTRSASPSATRRSSPSTPPVLPPNTTCSTPAANRPTTKPFKASQPQSTRDDQNSTASCAQSGCIIIFVIWLLYWLVQWIAS